VNVSDFAQLLTGAAAIITALSGAFVSIWAITRGSPRERELAARGAVQKVLDMPDDDDDDLQEAIGELIEELRRKRGDG
jgi:hypothetical protein